MGAQRSLNETIFFSLALLLLGCSQEYVNVVLSKSIIRSLPGFEGDLPFELETGYVSVDEANDVHLFYYFVKSERNPSEDPLILWIDGGPGCSSLCGLAFEIGPLNFKSKEYDETLPCLVLAKYSWTKVANVIFLDTPVGSGYSYSGTQRGWQTSDSTLAEQTYTFLRKWLTDHPTFLHNMFYIAGLSYSGIPIPIIAHEVFTGNEARNEPSINLKGYLLGNPGADSHVELNSIVKFVHAMNLISDELFELAKKQCNEEYIIVDPSNTKCLNAIKMIDKCISHINAYQVLEPHCPTEAIEPNLMSKLNSSGFGFLTVQPFPTQEHMLLTKVNHQENCMEVDKGDITSTIKSYGGQYFEAPQPPSLPSNPVLECRTYVYKLGYYWANNKIVQKALNVREGTINEWIRCNLDIPYKREFKNVVKFHQTLSTKGHRILIFSGDHDSRVPSFATEAWIKSLNFPVIDEWRPWFVEGQISGYTRSYANNITFATLKGGGHEVPMYKPRECFAMFKRWISHHPL